MTERLHFHFSLSCIGEGNGNLLQCSCLENPRVRGAWWAAIYGVAQSRTRLKRLSSSSSKYTNNTRQSMICVRGGGVTEIQSKERIKSNQEQLPGRLTIWTWSCRISKTLLETGDGSHPIGGRKNIRDKQLEGCKPHPGKSDGNLVCLLKRPRRCLLWLHIFQNWNDTEKISMTPAQGWNANLSNIPYFLN